MIIQPVIIPFHQLDIKVPKYAGDYEPDFRVGKILANAVPWAGRKWAERSFVIAGEGRVIVGVARRKPAFRPECEGLNKVFRGVVGSPLID